MRYIILLLIAILFTSCKKDSPTEPVDNSSVGIIPLKIGNSWTYHSKPYNETGTLRIIKDTIIKGDKWYKYGLDEEFSSWVKNKSDGLWMMDSRLGYSYLLLKYPAKEGDYYFIIGDSSTGYYEKTVVKSVNETVQVPAGTFKCYKYEYYRYMFNPPPKIEWKVWVAPNIGIIKEQYYYEDGTLRETVELLSYSLK